MAPASDHSRQQQQQQQHPHPQPHHLALAQFQRALQRPGAEYARQALVHAELAASAPPALRMRHTPEAETTRSDSQKSQPDPEPVDERLKNIDPKMIETIRNEIMDHLPSVSWCKTMIGKCIASQAQATFFNISSSSLTSKWVGDGEKMVRALFAVARVHQPSVIFVDEIDSLLTQRSEGEIEATRRIKTEFLVQFDGCGTDSDDRILMIGATNRPQEIDEAARRRFRKKLYIPLPDSQARRHIMETLLRKQVHALTEHDMDDIVRRTEGYSGSDMDGLIREAALGPIRDISDITLIDAEDVRPISHGDFVEALTQVRASVSEKDLDFYLSFDREYGSMNSAR
nr:hypothetical protein HK105_005763 [Polyrhizophydium stewartii]